MKSKFFEFKKVLRKTHLEDKQLLAMTKKVSAAMPNTTPFYLGDVRQSDEGEIIKSLEMAAKMDLPIQWPYDNVILFWNLVKEKPNGFGICMAAHIMTDTKDKSIFNVNFLFKPEEDTWWMLHPQNMTVFRDENNKVKYQSQLLTKLADGFMEEMCLQQSINWLAVAVHFNVLLNCKNIRMMDGVETAVIRSKRKKSNKRKANKVQIEFKTLVLDLTPKQQKHFGLPASVPVGSTGFHMCRGHFKDYRKGKGLFGRYKGIYWWPALIRGNNKNKIIIKDYEIKGGQ